MSLQTNFLDDQNLFDLSKLLSDISKEMYNLPKKNPGTNRSWKLEPGFERIIDNTKQARASIYSSSDKNFKGHYIVAFKGTDPNEAGDIVTDINFLPKKFKPTKNRGSKDAKVHRGFYKMYKKMSSELFKFMKNNDVKKLYITGHSLGGALSHIFLYDLIVSLGKKMPETVCIAIASPRIGNYYAKVDFTSRLRRMPNRKVSYVNLIGGLDPIPRFPMTSIEMSYASPLPFAVAAAKLASKINPTRAITYYDSGQQLLIGMGGHSLKNYIRDIPTHFKPDK